MENIQSVYKQVKVRDGKYYSCFCGKPPEGTGGGGTDNSELEYKVGQVTESLPSSPGIYCYTDKDTCIEAGQNHYDMWEGNKAAVLECYPIGEKAPDAVPGRVNYPAVYVKSTVWKEPDKFKEPEWIDVTMECTFGVYEGGKQGTLVEMSHNGNTFAWMGINGIVHPVRELQGPSGSRGYKLESTGDKTTDGAQYFKVLRRIK